MGIFVLRIPEKCARTDPTLGQGSIEHAFLEPRKLQPQSISNYKNLLSWLKYRWPILGRYDVDVFSLPASPFID